MCSANLSLLPFPTLFYCCFRPFLDRLPVVFEDSGGGLSASDSELKFVMLMWYSLTGLAGGVSGCLSAGSSFCSILAGIGLGSFASSSCRMVSTSWANMDLLVEGVAGEGSTSLAIAS